MTERLYLVYVTAGNLEEAQKIARTLVQERLVACANVYPQIYSYYWWEGEVQEDQEVSMILKTRGGLMDELIQRIKELHSYSCPCIVALPIEEGAEDFCAWILKETNFSPA